MMRKRKMTPEECARLERATRWSEEDGKRVWHLSDASGLSLRSAALVSGIREVAAALEVRGIYP